MIRTLCLLSFVALAIPLSGCTIETVPGPQTAEVYEAPPAAPPPPVYSEPIPPAPSYQDAWVGGNYRWDGHRYDWQRGHYEHRPRPNARYIPGHWEPRGRGHVWIEAHWG